MQRHSEIYKKYWKFKTHESYVSCSLNTIFAKNEAESMSYPFYIISENIYRYIIYSSVGRCLAEGYRLGSLLAPFHLRSISLSFSPRPTSDLEDEINSAFLRNWRASGVEDIFSGPPENSLFRVICFSIKVGYRAWVR